VKRVAHLPSLGLEPGGHRDARPPVTFPSVGNHWPVIGVPICDRGTCVWTTCLRVYLTAARHGYKSRKPVTAGNDNCGVRISPTVCYSTVRPLSTLEYTSVASMVASVFHSRQWSNLIHDRCSCTLFTVSSMWHSVSSMRAYFTLGRSPDEANSVVLTICIVGVSWDKCVDSSVNRPCANGRVSYDSLTHSRPL